MDIDGKLAAVAGIAFAVGTAVGSVVTVLERKRRAKKVEKVKEEHPDADLSVVGEKSETKSKKAA